ncbi:MAG: type IV pilin [Candidatus Thermoplasmatota archaeon]|nr:type IV pilin [Candidatus Thermoplasmatota archaeon]
MTKLHQKIGKIWKDKTGVSPIIAVILMVAITVVLAATIYVWVSGFGGGGSQSISMAVGQRGAEEGGNVTFRVDSVSQGTTWNDIEWKTAGGYQQTFNATAGADPYTGEDSIQAGDEFVVEGSAGDTLTIRDKTSNSIVLTKTIW